MPQIQVDAGSADVPPTQQVRWAKYPLFALAIVAVGPSILAPFVYIGLRSFGIDNLDGYKMEFSGSTIAFMLVFPVVSAIANVSFFLLSKISVWRARKEWPHLLSVKIAMWFSLIAMCIPNTLLFIGTPQEMILKAPNAGQGSGLAIVGLFLTLPIFGLLGWFGGRLVAWALRKFQ
ncbi:hypothetical protein [Bradyrhizobium guangxiense]|uniref:hypothetical protein n=1 Tax=Bradyrhizobium guangxiense TaxID=1325115 RepID=UPI001008F906|nr:hypothetical protein [Bradyrhizobium guangxiense]